MMIVFPVEFRLDISYHDTICCTERVSDVVRTPDLIASDSICSAVEKALERMKKQKQRHDRKLSSLT